MARVLLVGGGCRARALATGLVAAGHAVRATTRDPAGQDAIRASGAEAYVGDPDRIATLMGALTGVTVVAWLMGTATGDREGVFALHDTRLRMLWEKLVDTPVRGVVYEAAGSVDEAALIRGEAVARVAHETWHIPLEYVRADPADQTAWVADARRAVDALLGL
jgi:nucleoside-diphosphate-sugar epimerase